MEAALGEKVEAEAAAVAAADDAATSAEEQGRQWLAAAAAAAALRAEVESIMAELRSRLASMSDHCKAIKSEAAEDKTSRDSQAA